MSEYFYARDGQQQGPVSMEVLKSMAAGGQLSPIDLVWTEGMAQWAPAGTLPEFSASFPAVAGAPAGVGALGYQTLESYAPIGLKPVSFSKYLVLMLGGFGLIFVAGVIAGLDGGSSREPSPAMLTSLLLGLGVFLAGWIYGLVILYRAWKLVPPQIARTTPGKAVGFLFIPLFNLYWVFQAFWGLAKDYGVAVRARNPGAPGISEGLALATAIVVILSNVPMCGSIFGVVAMILDIILTLQLCKAINYAYQLLPSSSQSH